MLIYVEVLQKIMLPYAEISATQTMATFTVHNVNNVPFNGDVSGYLYLMNASLTATTKAKAANVMTFQFDTSKNQDWHKIWLIVSG